MIERSTCARLGHLDTRHVGVFLFASVIVEITLFDNFGCVVSCWSLETKQLIHLVHPNALRLVDKEPSVDRRQYKHACKEDIHSVIHT